MKNRLNITIRDIRRAMNQLNGANAVVLPSSVNIVTGGNGGGGAGGSLTIFMDPFLKSERTKKWAKLFE